MHDDNIGKVLVGS